MLDRKIDHTAAPHALSRLPVSGAAVPDLGRALASVLDLSAGELEAVLCAAEAQRPGVRQALGAAFEAEAHRLADLSRRAFAAADRLAAHLASAE
ncbi:hypothetical protein MKK75_00530 [Methylobacterium sp. J-030]|uniref:hypothetical protein n=1 Tax=Methylobacterium sp. J-030 TaxID=2836627 RepID=UPI001FBBDF89|nr:hypothetical protein [Methylobacterium sp. J-030]MCJ2067307.1 hypothetical protein [Methylobacterium sp. J-030]